MKDYIRKIEGLYKSAEQFTGSLQSPYQKNHMLTNEDLALLADITLLLSQEVSHNHATKAFKDTVSEVSTHILFLTKV